MTAPNPLIQSPFDSAVAGRTPSRSGQIGIHLNPQLLGSLTLLGTWVGNSAQLTQAVANHIAGPVPATTGQVQVTGSTTLMRVGPEELWAISDQTPDGGAHWRSVLPPDVATVSDLSHARCKVQLSGPQTLALLAKLLALDTRPTAFPQGQCRHSAHHHVPWLLHRLGEQQFDIYITTTYARDALAAMVDGALEFGVEVVG
jgi:heterotetrameric sarcosine oxidase gamma subunit